MRTPLKRLLVLVGALLLAVGFGASPAGAETTPTQTQTIDLGDLDESGTGTFDAFDPALGTLTQVDITAEVDMNFSVCATNTSPDAGDSLPAGDVSGSAPITFAGDVVVNAAGEMTFPDTPLDAFDDGDDCSVWLDSGTETEPSTGDSVLLTETDTSTFAETITDATALEAYVGPGTVDFSFAASSDSNISQPSQWTIIFLADGAGEVTVTYTYDTDPEVSPTTSTPEVLPQQSELPRTGAGDGVNWLAASGGWLVLCGAVLTGAGRVRAARRRI